MELGETIKKYRKLMDLSQEELAERSGLSRVSIGNYERGDRKPSPVALKKIAREIGLPHEYLMEVAGYIDREEVRQLEERFYALEQESESLVSKLSEAEDSLKQELQEKLQNIKLEQEQIQLKIFSLEKNHVVESFKSLGDSLNEHIAAQKNEEKEATSIYLDENNEGNFYFFNKEGRLPDEIQEKLRALIKITLD